ncbi:MAG: nucleotide pyrophosphohydrolase [Halofilum sp. (in: g-proteobacteria)]
MSTETNEYEELLGRLRNFASERDWSQFHTPKNLAMALTGEVGELVEHFQWLSSEASDSLDAEAQREVRRELADVQIYAMLLADRLGIDLMEAVRDKIEENEGKYPAERARGRSNKYNDL